MNKLGQVQERSLRLLARVIELVLPLNRKSQRMRDLLIIVLETQKNLTLSYLSLTNDTDVENKTFLSLFTFF